MADVARPGRWRRALVYFGLVEDPRGAPVSGDLRAEVEDLRRRVAALERRVGVGDGGGRRR